MKTSSSSSNSGGIGLGGTIFIVFLVLKLIGQIGWSWWWVTSPLWISAGFVFAIFVVVFLIMLVVQAFTKL